MSNNNRKIDTQAGLDRAVWEVCNILRRDKAKGARLYVPELTWMLFLCALDAKEHEEEQRAAAVGQSFSATLAPPYRWRDWAAAFDRRVPVSEAVEKRLPGWKRQELTSPALDPFAGNSRSLPLVGKNRHVAQRSAPVARPRNTMSACV